MMPTQTGIWRVSNILGQEGSTLSLIAKNKNEVQLELNQRCSTCDYKAVMIGTIPILFKDAEKRGRFVLKVSDMADYYFTSINVHGKMGISIGVANVKTYRFKIMAMIERYRLKRYEPEYDFDIIEIR